MIQLTDEQLHLLGRVITGDVLDAMEFPPIRWAVPGLIPEGFGLLTGAPKCGKSWAVLGLGLAIAEGGFALGKVPTGEPRPVLYLALEDGHRRLQSRARHLLGSGTPIPKHLNVVTEVTKANVLPLIHLWLSQRGNESAVVVLDTLGKVMPPALPGEGPYERDYRVGGELKRIAADFTGSSIIVVHHVRKQSGDDWMDSTSGSNGLNGSADFTLNLSRSRNESEGLLRITGRDVVEAEYAVTITDGAWELQGENFKEAAKAAQQAAETQRLGADSLRLLAWANTQPEEFTPTDAAKAMGWMTATGKPDHRAASTYLGRLHERGSISKPRRGHYKCVDSVDSVDFQHSPLIPTGDKSTQSTQSTQFEGWE